MKIKCILKKIFFLPPLLTVLISLPSFALCFYLLGIDYNGILSYISYTLSAYALIITITGITDIVRVIRKSVRNHPLVKKALTNQKVEKFTADVKFRTKISLYCGFSINLMYAVIKLVSGVYYHSAWFGTLAAYYALLAVMRFLLLDAARKNHIKPNLLAEFKRYRICGILLAFMTLALSVMVLFIVRRNGNYSYPGLFIYVMALYAFYSVITAVINLVKFRKHKSPVLSAAKVINLTAALVSMLALETAMLDQFGSEEEQVFRHIMTAISGGAVCVIVLVMAFFMIAKSAKQLKQLDTANG